MLRSSQVFIMAYNKTVVYKGNHDIWKEWHVEGNWISHIDEKTDLMDLIWGEDCWEVSQIPNCNIFLFIEGILYRIFSKFICDCNKIPYRIRRINWNIFVYTWGHERKKLWEKLDGIRGLVIQDVDIKKSEKEFAVQDVDVKKVRKNSQFKM